MESATKVAPGGLENGSGEVAAKPGKRRTQACAGNKQTLVSAQQRWQAVGARGLPKSTPAAGKRSVRREG